MVRVQKLVRAIAAASALMSGAAQALSLGEIHLNSALNQPFDATIDLSDLRDLGTADLRPNLASVEEFGKAGVDRAFFLNDLKFTPELRNGRTVIRVTSARPVREPYLNFLLEVNWPSGRILREYTVLLDPPLYTPQAAAAPFAPQVPATPRARTTTPSAPRPATPPAAPAPSATQTPGTYTTERRDTLWEVAARNRPASSVTVDQTMLAIQDLNPDAFIDRNINLMKSGQVLRLPDQAQAGTRPQREAVAEIARQTRAWKQGGEGAPAGTPRRQVDASAQPSGNEASTPAAPKDNLKLLSGQPAGRAGESSGGKGSDQSLADRLAVTQESLDTTRRENDELKSRLGDLQSQLDKLQKIMQLKDAQLARMQANMANPQAAGQPAQPPATPEAAAPVTPAPVENTPAPASQEPTAAAPVAPVDATAPTATPPASEAGTGSAPPVASEPKVIPVTPSTPATEPTEATNSFLDEILSNPLWLGIIGGSALLALLVLLMINSRRNAVKEAERERDAEAARTDTVFDADPELGDHHALAGLELNQGSQDAARDADAQDDALGQADIYMAYGRFSQAAEVLKKASDQEPHRADLRLKLMEVYAEMGDKDGFQREERELKEIGGAQPAVEHLKSRYPAMATVAVASAAVGAAALAAAHELSEEQSRNQGFSTTEDSQDFDLSLDDFGSEDTQGHQPAGPAEEPLFGEAFADAQAKATQPRDDFDFDLNFDAEPAATSAATPAAKDDDFALDFSEFERQGDLAHDEPVAGSSASSAFDEPLDAPTPPAADAELPASFDLSDFDDEQPASKRESDEEFAVRLQEASRQFDAETAGGTAGSDGLDDFDFLSGEDETATKLDLARAYIDMGDPEGARDILDEVIAEGNAGQQQEAREIIAQLS
ncbi:FimV/HubP family polar landmark protein [Pseudomonas sp. 102515]|uniref:FimV/HubP family polar landmark protein n=1 Tax=Pseudomonas sp. 102515 TaxID=3071568 RepID=UPI00280078C7|nr:FimV/HubP family polar landmark protein [Pseudomonas sp. 102515]MDQ7911979.1 FimV/HubP family polar landmark protein [Pseudomonas sp. 102515]